MASLSRRKASGGTSVALLTNHSNGSSELHSAGSVGVVNTELPEIPDATALRPLGAAPRKIRRLINDLQTPVDVAPLALFRMFFGAVMLYHVYSYMRDHWIDVFYVHPDFHLTYHWFGWVRPWPGELMHAYFVALGFSALAILLGCFYRLATVAFCVGFTHVFLMEKALYQNHYYLICLLSFLMIFLPCHRCWSIDALRKPESKSDRMAAGWLWLLRFQLAVPYFYGGIAKLNADWLQAMPIRLWLERRAHLPWIGPYLEWQVMGHVFAWAGLLYDLLIVPLLLWKRTRWLGYLLSLGFHLMNSILWEIGIFPWFMIGATLLFFPPESFRKALRLPSLPESTAQEDRVTGRRFSVLSTLVTVYVMIQLIVPFRHLALPGNPSWTEEGHHFAWHMMLREKDVGIRFFVRDRTTGERGLLKVSDFLNQRQLSRMGKDPDLILQFVHHVRDHYRDHGRELEIRVLALCSLNGRKPQLLIDPALDYTRVERHMLTTQPWIVPLSEPLRKEGWSVPLEQWEIVLADLIPEDMRLIDSSTPDPASASSEVHTRGGPTRKDDSGVDAFGGVH